MITLEAYWKGRDTEYADELTDEIRANAEVTVAKANELLARRLLQKAQQAPFAHLQAASRGHALQRCHPAACAFHARVVAAAQVVP